MSRPCLPAILPAFMMQACRSAGRLAERLAAEADRAHGDRMLRQRDFRADFVELHLLDAGRFVLGALITPVWMAL